MPDNSTTFDIIIAGSGFAGSLTALALHNSGFKVGVIEKGSHPRFALGESSTPIADMILRTLSKRYQLPWLYDFSRYGSWQKAHPEVICGLKRGFSYFKHSPGKEFSTDENHSNELLVAASVSDELSDTNWLRSDFDAFLAGMVVKSGITYLDRTEIVTLFRENNAWEFELKNAEQSQTIHASFFIDSTGASALSEKFLSVKSSAQDFKTNSFAVFTHCDDFPRWMNRLHQRNIPTQDYPYDVDDSALHHILDEGWVWALRFNNERLSWGFTLNGNQTSLQQLPALEVWTIMQEKYPEMKLLLQNAKLSSMPGGIFKTERLQRKLERGYGEGWLALPHTIGFVDPLFSSGFAHSLCGMERVLKLLTSNRDFGPGLYEGLREFENAAVEELRMIDLLVAGCFHAMPHFHLFQSWSMLWFTFTIMYEQRRLNGQSYNYFLEAHRPEVREIAQTSFSELLKLTGRTNPSIEEMEKFRATIKKRIEPYNTAGLLDAKLKNMYQHTAAVL